MSDLGKWLDEVEARVRDCASYNFGMWNADKLAHVDAPRLVGMLRRALDRDGLMRVLNKAGAYCGMCSYDEGYGEDGCADCRKCLEAYAADLIAFIEGTETDRG